MSKREPSKTTQSKPDGCTLLGNVLSLEDAKKLAILGGEKIKHKYFLEDEFIYFENGKWLTEEGYELPYKYWLGMDANWQTGWSLHVA